MKWQLRKGKQFAAEAVKDGGSASLATHVRTDPRCQVHGETARQPSMPARNRVGVTTENGGIRPYNGGAWRVLIDEFTENRFTCIIRPLIQQTVSAIGPAEPEDTNTGDRGDYEDLLRCPSRTMLQRSGAGTEGTRGSSHTDAGVRYYRINGHHPHESGLRCTLSRRAARGGQRPLGG